MRCKQLKSSSYEKTIDVNIGSMPFVIDEDAYARLGDYLIDVRNRLPDSEVSDVMEDIKSRIADIFTENIKTTSGIVTIELVHRMISIIGSPSTFGDMGNDPLFTPPTTPYAGERRLYRSRNRNILAGVCGGISDYFGIDALAVRIITVILAFAAGLTIWIYLILWIIIPLAPISSSYFNRKAYERR